MTTNSPLSVPLSEHVRRAVDALWESTEAVIATELLETRCGSGVAGWHHTNQPGDFDRVRLAAIKVSNGKLQVLEEAVNLANLDYRDLLCWAGFSHDAHTHRTWMPTPRRRLPGHYVVVPAGFSPPRRIQNGTEFYHAVSWLAERLWSANRHGEAHRLDSLMVMSWTTSTELIGELCLVLGALRPSLANDEAAIASECLRWAQSIGIHRGG